MKCETDFVAQNADFVKLTQDILDLAVANKCATLDEVKALPMGNGTVQDAVTDRSGITGEKMELDGYMTVEGVCTAVYNHMNRNGLCTIVAFNKEVNEQLAKQIAMQIAAMNPIAIDEDGVSEEVKQKEIEVAIEKTKAEQVQKAVEAALKKANINPAHVDSEEHMDSNMAKGWITAEDVAKAKEIIATVSAEKAAHLPEQMIQNIAKEMCIRDSSNTPRHLAEFWMIEPEVAFNDITDNMDLAEEFIKYCVKWALDNCADDVKFLNDMFDKGLIERLQGVLKDDFVRLPYTDGIKILEEAVAKGHKFEFPVYWGVDLASEHERFLVEEHFKRPVILTDYPKEIKAFYMKQNDCLLYTSECKGFLERRI